MALLWWCSASVGDDVTDVEYPGLVDDHVVMEKRVHWMTDAPPELTDSTLIARSWIQGA
jgi:hypothetical protein